MLSSAPTARPLNCLPAPRVLVLAAAVLLAAAAPARGYDPLARPPDFVARTLELSVRDAGRDREIPVLAWLPAEPGPRPLLLFSHGLGGARSMNGYLGRHWSARGYLVLMLQHPGSDDSVWRGRRALGALVAMKAAASPENFLLRVVDVPVVIRAALEWNRASVHPLAGRIDPARIGMSGHSFGAVTAQAVAGQRGRTDAFSFTDPRIRAAVIMSPSVPRDGTNPERAFGAVAVPWMLLTGTNDDARIVNLSSESRFGVFPALPESGHFYELVLAGAEHSAFTDRPLPGDRLQRNPAHHRAILAFSTAFWDAHLCGEPAARAWLAGDGASAALSPDDRYRRKEGLVSE